MSYSFLATFGRVLKTYCWNICLIFVSMCLKAWTLTLKKQKCYINAESTRFQPHPPEEANVMRWTQDLGGASKLCEHRCSKPATVPCHICREIMEVLSKMMFACLLASIVKLDYWGVLPFVKSEEVRCFVWCFGWKACLFVQNRRCLKYFLKLEVLSLCC